EAAIGIVVAEAAALHRRARSAGPPHDRAYERAIPHREVRAVAGVLDTRRRARPAAHATRVAGTADLERARPSLATERGVGEGRERVVELAVAFRERQVAVAVAGGRLARRPPRHRAIGSTRRLGEVVAELDRRRAACDERGVAVERVERGARPAGAD